MTDIQMTGMQLEGFQLGGLVAAARACRDGRGIDALFAQLIALGPPALARQSGAGAEPARVWVDTGLQARARAVGREHWVQEFMAFHAADDAGWTPAVRAVRSCCDFSCADQAGLVEMAASHWELHELLEVAPGAGESGRRPAPGALTLRRVYDDAVIQVAHVIGGQTARVGEVGAWRVIDVQGFLAAPAPLALDQARVPALVRRLDAERSSWRANMASTRADYMRQRGSFVILSHALCAPRVQGSALDFWALSRRVDPLVSPVESGLSAQCWRPVSDAFARLESLAFDRWAGRDEVAYPRAILLAAGEVLVLEQACESLLVTLLDSREAHQRWEAQRHALHRNAGVTGRASAATALVRCWRARADEIFDADVEFFARAGFEPVESGVVLAVCLRADWRWEDLDAHALRRLTAAMCEGARRLAARTLAA